MGTRARIVSQLLSSANVGAGGNLNISDVLPLLTTANVVETSNLYYTNLRVYANLELASIAVLQDVDDNVSLANVGDVLIFDGNIWYAGILDTNVAEFSETSNVANTVLTLSNFTTDDLVEGANNLYFTNALSRFAISAANPTIIYDPFTGEISANLTAVAASANTTDTLPEGFVNRYFTNARVVSNVQTLSINTFADVNVDGATNGKVLVYDANLLAWVPGDEVFRSIIAEEANTVLQIDNFTTDELAEGANNLYFTNTRVEDAITRSLANISIDDLFDVNTQVGLQVESFLFWDGNNWVPRTIDNVTASVNAEFAERSNIANLALVSLYTEFAENSNVANTSLFAFVANIATTAARAAFANLAAYANLAGNATYAEFANVALNNLSLDTFTTDNLAEGSNNLYYTDARVFANISQTSINIHNDVDVNYSNTSAGDVLSWSGTQWIASNVIAEARAADFAELANIANTVLTLSNFTSDDLAEGITNRYYDSSRVDDDIYDILRSKDLIEVQNLRATGNIEVRGDTAIFDVDEFTTQSKTIVIADGAGSAEGAGLYFGAGANASITYSFLGDRIGIDKNVVIQGNLLPAVSGEYNIGDQTRFWKGIYIGGRTLFLGNLVLSQSPTGGLDIADASGNPVDVELGNVTLGDVTTNRLEGNILTFFSNALILEAPNVTVNGNTIPEIARDSISSVNPTISVYSNTYATLGYNNDTGVITVNKDGVYEATAILTLTSDWQDTPIKAAFIPTGTYVVQIKANDSSVGGGHTNEYYSGVMSWYSNDTDSVIFDEIVMHRAGAGVGSGTIFLRVIRTETLDSDDLKLQIAGTTNNSGVSSYNFKFRRLL